MCSILKNCGKKLPENMNKKMYLLFNHTLTTDQKKDAEIHWNISEFLDLPEVLSKLWRSIPPDNNLDLIAHLKPIVDYFKTKKSKGYVLTEGDFGGVYYMVNKLKDLGYTPLYSTTERNVKETRLEDGTISTKRKFKHVCFRKYI